MRCLALAFVGLLVALAPAAGPAKPAPPKITPPDSAAVAEAVAAIKTLYKADYAKRRPADVAQLARKLLVKASETNDDPVYRFALLKEAGELAGQGGDSVLALRVIDTLAAYYTVNALGLKVEALGRASKDAPAATAGEALEMTLVMVGEAVQADSYDLALKLLTSAEALAVRANTPAARKRIEPKLAAVRELDAAAASSQAALLAAQRGTATGEVALAAGRFLGAMKGDWKRALPLLAKTDDSEWSRPAQMELAKPADAKAMSELAGLWAGRAETEQGVARTHLSAHALHWFQLAWDRLNGAALVEAEKRMAVLATRLPEFDSTPLGEQVTYVAHRGNVFRAQFTPDGRRIVSVGDDGLVAIHATYSGRELRKLSGHTGPVHSVAITSDGTQAITGGVDKTLRVWDLDSGRELGRVDGVESYSGVCVLPDGKKFLSVGTDKLLRQWAFDTRKEIRRMPGHASWVSRVCSSPDGKTAMSVGYNGQAKLWNLATGREIRMFVGHGGEIYDGAFSPDSRQVVTAGGMEKTARVWDVATGRELRRFENSVMCCFHPDGRRVCTGEDTGRVRVWDVATGLELLVFPGHPNAMVRTVQVSPDGRLLMSAGGDGQIHLWRLPR